MDQGIQLSVHSSKTSEHLRVGAHRGKNRSRGQRIFETQDPAVFWDGTYNFRMVQTGVYTWKLT
ncbi:MAG: hypothetical protein DCO96_03350 [Fluviicola sp. XM-24bin1]|nr:MAG: hypothetical protein DCO96_03350 [Fluviicola sp. XM-24bin1]